MRMLRRNSLHSNCGRRKGRAHAGRVPSSTPRSGVALVMFALLVFAFMGIAALTIDMGIASLTQAQMQNAADTAALEGVRLRDFAGYRVLFSDPLRRPHVSELVQMVFDDNLHPTGGVEGTAQSPSHGGVTPLEADDPDQLQFGVGPHWSVTGGGVGNVGATLNPFDASLSQIDDPVLQYNASNRPYGDMLSGTYNPFSNHLETNYQRPDFDPPPAVDTNHAGANSIGFLVRMRRTNGGAFDHQAGVSSGGPTLPFVFGLGSMMMPGQPGEYDPRTEGLTVRAVAIAAGRPAMAIGPSPNMNDLFDKPMLGMGYWYTPTGGSVQKLSPPLALSLTFWSTALQLHTPVTLSVDPNDSTHGSILYDSSHIAVGMFLEGGPGRCIGEEVIAVTPATDIPADGVQRAAFFPIYTRILNADGDPTDRIVGFGYGDVVHFDPGGGEPPVWSVSKGFTTLDGSAIGGGTVCAVWVPPTNASAHLTSRAPPLSELEWDNVFDAYNRFGYPLYDPPNGHPISFDWADIRPGTVLAPVLVR